MILQYCDVAMLKNSIYARNFSKNILSAYPLRVTEVCFSNFVFLEMGKQFEILWK